ncbi:MAG: hypothetical protein U5J83_03665 [Bryobacterales bacterium]|nr:hypothetical protein [Bryobacterales bacterium]
MNMFAQMDKSMVIGYLKQANSTDQEVLRSRYMDLRSKMDLVRKLLLIPLVIGCLQIAVGVIGLIIIVGVILLIPGGLFAGVSWWGRKRLRQNMAVLDAAYREFIGVPLTPPLAQPQSA